MGRLKVWRRSTPALQAGLIWRHCGAWAADGCNGQQVRLQWAADSSNWQQAWLISEWL